MLKTAATFAAVLASTAITLAAKPAAEPLPSRPLKAASMVVRVTAAADIPRDVITATLREADSIWRAAGFNFEWDRGPRVGPAELQVVIGGGRSPVAAQMPLAWIGFDELGAPTSQLYVSHANAVSFMANSRETVGLVETMTNAQRYMYLGRAMGRALAHELGHFLLASRSHSVHGLMMATHTAFQFFNGDRKSFAIDASERRLVASRFPAIYVASRG